MVGLENVDLVRHVGLSKDGGQAVKLDTDMIHRIIAVKLASQGFDVPSHRKEEGDEDVLNLAGDLFRLFEEQSRLLQSHLCPIDKRIQDFLDDALASTGEKVNLPSRTVTVDRYGLAKELSLPEVGDEFRNAEVSSYRLKNGVLHNPLNDRRTTKGVFHVADYGLPVPGDKIKVPLVTYARLLKTAFNPPSDLKTLPYTSKWSKPAETIVSLHLRPLVCPAVPGVIDEKRAEIRFFVPGGCVANLDFVESIFGNAGDPSLPDNDAGLDTDHWTGTTGCVVLAPHLRTVKKKEMGLPFVDDATDEQKRTGMCWSDPEELYNGGKPFKITMRDVRGIMVTILADNYFGYCKKEVKTQIGLSANIFGLAEEEHAGGALAFKSVNLGDRFEPKARYMEVVEPKRKITERYSFDNAVKLLGDSVVVHPEGYATDKRFEHIHILPEDMVIDLHSQKATWTSNGQQHSLRVIGGHVYIHPSGFKVQVAKHPKASIWRLVGTLAEATYCHKPSTVSGGGKSEISKSLNDAVVYGPIYISDYDSDMECVKSILDRDFTGCFKPEYAPLFSNPSRPILSTERTLGSVIKLLTPDEIYTEEHNAFLETIPSHIRAIVFAIKQHYKPEWGSDWVQHFAVDITNGDSGHELKVDDQSIVGSYLRVGFGKKGTWRNYKMRQDFVSASKVQMEDDITASTVVPREKVIGLPKEYDSFPSVKIAQNCEYRLFQRPDDAIHPGYDKLTEKDMSTIGLFASNFEPTSREEMKLLTEQLNLFDRFTLEMQNHMIECVENGTATQKNVCSAKPRIVDGKPTKNPRYLQVRPDVAVPEDRYLAELGARLYRRIPVTASCLFPVVGVLGGRRNNPPDELNGMKIRPLCVFNPIHYQELPEMFMDWVTCVTGKSPSTTGAGFEGALSKGPFNAIGATADLNNALVSMLITGYGGYSSAAGWIGPKYRVDHDISLLVPEVWCRMTPQERDPKYLIERGELEKVEDFEFEGRTIPASRLGYRITKRFVHAYFCRIFDHPSGAFPEDMLQPETQDMAVFIDGVENIAQAQQKCAVVYFKDGTIEDACPPLKAVLNVMAYGHYNGKSIHDPEIRSMFTREALLESDWYKQRLKKKQERDIGLCEANVAYLESFMKRPGYDGEVTRLQVAERLEKARLRLGYLSSDEYLASLVGTIGADPIHKISGAKEKAKPTQEGVKEVKEAEIGIVPPPLAETQ